MNHNYIEVIKINHNYINGLNLLRKLNQINQHLKGCEINIPSFNLSEKYINLSIGCELDVMGANSMNYLKEVQL